MPEPSLIDQPAAVRPGEELDVARLTAYLRDHLPEARGPLVVEQFPGGMSNLTYCLRLGDRDLVLRRPPFGANIKGGHDMGREYRILRALVAVYPRVPRPLLYCDDDTVLGAPFYVMERVRGVILRTRIPPDVESDPELMRRICLALIDTLTELHAIDYHAAGLADLGRPEGYTTRQVNGWTRRYRDARTDDCPDLEPLADWLQNHMPARADATLIHNDFRYDNVVLDPTDLTRIIAVLDWEMATLGHPLTDLGTTLAYWTEPEDPDVLRQFGPTTQPGNLDRQQVLQHYAERSRRDVSDILFYYVYGVFKNMVIVLQIYARYRRGLTRDPRFAPLIDLIRIYADLANRALERGRISHLFS
jgi:aminoglycoside phosphotransferase (APT) family kinase protein